MTRDRPTPDRLDTPDAPPTAGLRCPRCGGAPTLRTDRLRPEDCGSRVAIFEATLTCCRHAAGGSGYGERQAVDHAAGRWLRLYPTPEESGDA